MFKLYFCVDCREVHYDGDCCFEEGDLEITNWKKFLKSVEYIKQTQNSSTKGGGK